MLNLCTIASGSSGNCSYVGIGGENFLVDAGVSGKTIENALFMRNIRNIHGIFITHEHRDHIVGAGVMARRFKLKLYATPHTWRYFANHKSLGALDAPQINIIEPQKPININGVKITAFDISHDAAQPVGYTFECDGRKIATATDLGCVTDNVRHHLKDSDMILLESNHDPMMLQNGPYHQGLKDRVASPRGHLSNAQAGALLAEVASPKLQHIALAHLSEDNNTPYTAFETVKNILDAHSIRIKTLAVAERNKPGEMMQVWLSPPPNSKP